MTAYAWVDASHQIITADHRPLVAPTLDGIRDLEAQLPDAAAPAYLASITVVEVLGRAEGLGRANRLLDEHHPLDPDPVPNPDGTTDCLYCGFRCTTSGHDTSVSAELVEKWIAAEDAEWGGE